LSLFPGSSIGAIGFRCHGIRRRCAHTKMVSSIHNFDSAFTSSRRWSDEGREKWLMVHTRSRYEKILAGRLQVRNGIVFAPLMNARRTYGGLDATVELPLFTRLLFFKGRSTLLNEPDLAHCISDVN